MMYMLSRIERSEKGQGLVEYGLILALVSVMAVGGLGGVGDSAIRTFHRVESSLSVHSPDPKWEEYLATDDEFIGEKNGEFKYIGNKEIVYLPHTIKGQRISSYSGMFSEVDDRHVQKVISDNPDIVDLGGMFLYSKASRHDLCDFHTSNVKNMEQMFNNSSASEMDLSGLNTSKVESMRGMFHNVSLNALDLQSFDTGQVVNMRRMFWSARVDNLDVSSFNTSRVTSMERMFTNVQTDHIDVSGFDTQNVEDMSNMFALSNVSLLDLSSFDTSGVLSMNGIFDRSHATKGYARTKSDADRFNASIGIPSTLTFIMK